MFQIIISPAKKMNVDTESFAISGMPQFPMHIIQSLSLADARTLWKLLMNH